MKVYTIYNIHQNYTVGTFSTLELSREYLYKFLGYTPKTSEKKKTNELKSFRVCEDDLNTPLLRKCSYYEFLANLEVKVYKV